MTEQEIIYTMALTRVPRVNTAAQHRLMEELGSASLCSTTAITSVTFIPKLRTNWLPHYKEIGSPSAPCGRRTRICPACITSAACVTTMQIIPHAFGNATTLLCFSIIKAIQT